MTDNDTATDETQRTDDVDCVFGDPNTMLIAVSDLDAETVSEDDIRKLTERVHGYVAEDLGIQASSVSVVTDVDAFLDSVDAPRSNDGSQ